MHSTEASASWWLKNQKPQDMIALAAAMKLIQIHFHVCEEYERTLKYSYERMSPNQYQQLTDPETICTYLYAVYVELRFHVEQIHRYAKDHLMDRLPGFRLYAAFCSRLNRLSEAFRLLLDRLFDVLEGCSQALDSIPIITCSDKRSAKVAGDDRQDLTRIQGLMVYWYQVAPAGHGVQREAPAPGDALIDQ